MHVDWSSLNAGVQEELDKQAGVGAGLLKALPGVGNVFSGGMALNSALHGDFVGAGINAVGAIPGVGNAVSLGAMGADLLMPQSWRGNINKAIKMPYRAAKAVASIPGKISGAISGAGHALGSMAPVLLSALSGGARKGPAAQLAPQRTSMLTHGLEGVHSLGSPRTVTAEYSEKLAGVMDAISDAAKRRVANSVLNEVTNTTPLGTALAAPQQTASDKAKLELTSAHPEISQMLENPQTKAYLERLLQEQA
jgi:hypothetical protein